MKKTLFKLLLLACLQPALAMETDPQMDLNLQLAATVEKGDLEGAQQLLAAGADPNGFDNGTFVIPLEEAIDNGHISLVTLLMDYGADINHTRYTVWGSVTTRCLAIAALYKNIQTSLEMCQEIILHACIPPKRNIPKRGPARIRTALMCFKRLAIPKEISYKILCMNDLGTVVAELCTRRFTMKKKTPEPFIQVTALHIAYNTIKQLELLMDVALNSVTSLDILNRRNAPKTVPIKNILDSSKLKQNFGAQITENISARIRRINKL